MSKSIQEFKFSQVKNYPKAILVLNLFLFFCLATRGLDYIAAHPFTWFSLLSCIIVLPFLSLNMLRAPRNSIFVILVYVAILVLEFSVYGVPGNVMEIRSGNLSKGFLFDLAIALLPYLFVGLRIIAILCILPVLWHARYLSPEPA